jgi:hypothetical protein
MQEGKYKKCRRNEPRGLILQLPQVISERYKWTKAGRAAGNEEREWTRRMILMEVRTRRRGERTREQKSARENRRAHEENHMNGRANEEEKRAHERTEERTRRDNTGANEENRAREMGVLEWTTMSTGDEGGDEGADEGAD